jgi:hypothetical protein
LYLLHSKAWRGKEEMALSTLGELWTKGNEMDRGQAHALLNQVKLGMYVSEGKINEALYTTGDLDVTKLAPKACRSLRNDGPQSCYVRSSSLEDQGIGEGFKWSMDWNRKRNSNEIEGVKR